MSKEFDASNFALVKSFASDFICRVVIGGGGNITDHVLNMASNELADKITDAYKQGSDDAMQGNRSIKFALDQEFRRGQELMREKCAKKAEYGSCNDSGCDSDYRERPVKMKHSTLCPVGIAEAIRKIPIEGE